MASTSPIRRTAALSIGFFVILALLIALSSRLVPASDQLVEPVFVVIALAPPLFYLASSGQLKSFKGGGFEISLREQAARAVSDKPADETITVDPAVTQQKGSPRDLMSIDPEDPPTALLFTIGRTGYYSQHAIESYLHELGRFPEFQYVVFTEESEAGVEEFRGFMAAQSFERFLDSDSNVDLVPALESGRILEREGVNRASVRSDQSNQRALAVMDTWDVDELAVTDDAGTFVGVVTQDEIVRRMLAETIREV